MAEYKLDLQKIEEAVAHKAAAVTYPRTLISDLLEGIVDFFGKVFSWLWIALMLLVVSNVIMRYVLGTNFIALEELQWHLYAAGFMIGLSYCFVHDGHVRVDVLAEHLALRKRAVIEILGILILFLPFCYLILTYAYPFVERSYRINEVSAAPGGLPMRWIIKSVILVAFGLLMMAGVARLLRALSLLTGFPRARRLP
ncbi:TRAP transporter small permease subunit [Nitrincola alkalilacustris]|uniref:TRAP transporter small permease subunit n=1 Tax=Nitrincola alkalilacustris TaxID=1571224 RepID=UPI00124C7584|nr:TRAP transporter small permease subunit [Nitrincola alkalilacustris]